MSARTRVKVVAIRELRDRLGNRAFQVTTLLVLVLIVAALVLPSIFANDEGPKWRVLATPAAAAAIDGVDVAAQAIGATVDLAIEQDSEVAGQMLKDGGADLWLPDTATAVAEGEPDSSLVRLLEQVRRDVATRDFFDRNGIAVGEIEQALAGASLDVRRLDGADAEAALRDQALAAAITVLLFVMIQINGGMLLSGTIEEKSSRVAEVLLGGLRAWELLAGKLAAFTALALGQMTLYVVAVLGVNSIVDAVEIPASFGAAAGAGLVMFAVGFVFYAAVFIMAGALANSVEDANAASAPIIMMSMIGYILVLTVVVPNADGLVATVLTYLPPTAPFAVPTRMAIGAIGWGTVALAGTITLLASAATIRLAGRVYGAALLSGGKLKWRQLRQAEPIAK